jgi:hypothetical protein
MGKTIMQQRLKQQEALDKARPAEDQPVEQNNVTGPLRHYPSERTSSIKPETEQHIAPQYDPVQDELRMIEEESKYQLKVAKKEKFKHYFVKVFNVILIVSCVYLVFLIYGVMNTSYVYDNKSGDVVPLIVPVETIQKKADYELVSTQYLQARTLYEEVLKLDYRLSMAERTGEDPLLIAPEYEKILEKISSLSIQMSAQTVPAQYTQPYNMLLSWVQNDIALYCQHISKAISQNSVMDMNKSQEYRASMYNNFMRITELVATLGTQVDNVDVSIIYNWSPESFIEQYSGGL